MITADPMPIFPTCPTFGFTSEPRYLVKIVAREGGYERRDRKWARPLHRYSGVPMGDRAEADIQAVLYFWHAMGGMSTTFRFQDFVDYKSCPVQNAPAPTDMPFIELLDSPGGGFQLVKTYDHGAFQQLREIRHPNGATIRITNDVGDEQDPATWELDEATGILTLMSGFVGLPMAWGGEFYVPCRFDSELPVEVSNKQIQRLSLSVTEVREE